MKLNIDVQLDYELDAPSDILLQLEVAALADQNIETVSLDIPESKHFARIAGEEDVGERIWLRQEGEFKVDYQATVAIDRSESDCGQLRQTPVHELPGETVKYLMGSRYCQANQFQGFVQAEFGDTAGGERVMAMRDWIEQKFRYVPGVSNANTTARDTFVQRQGICRDYAHVLISLARASAIPARMVSVYALGVEPPDFHAVAEVWLDGGWHLIDPTGMAPVDGIARIGVGRDAADISFMTVYGVATLKTQRVSVSQTD